MKILKRVQWLLPIALLQTYAVAYPYAFACTDDNECKGARVCVSGACQDRTDSSQKLSVACGLLGDISGNIFLGLPTSNATALLKKIGDAANLENLPSILAGQVPNAAAMIQGTTRLIVYNPDFMEQLEQRSGS